MYPPEFEYRRAETTADALDWLATEESGDVRLLAGGHDLLPELKTGGTAPDVLVDIGQLGRLDSITLDSGDRDEVTVGALVTHADLVSSARLATRAPIIPKAAAHVGDIQIRNRGTVGGNLVAAKQGADLPPAMVAAEATLVVESKSGGREIPASEFFRGAGETALEEDELLVEIRIPAPGDDPATREGSAYVKKTHPATGYAMVGVAAVVGVGEGTLSTPRIAATGVTERPVRLPTVEDALDSVQVESTNALVSESVLTAATEATRADIDGEQLHSDVHASGEFRLEVLPTYVERAVRNAIEAATEQSVGGEDNE